MPTLLFNKPFGVICQFSGDGKRPTLADFIPVKDVYPAGRLDTDSEGLLILTDDGRLQNRISHPRHKLPKTYLAQVEGLPAEADLDKLRNGIELNDGAALPAGAHRIPEPESLWPRDPPIRYRKSIPASWLEIVLHEGRNRQVRRMTAAMGYPTLRLIRWRIGPWSLDELQPGTWREIN